MSGVLIRSNITCPDLVRYFSSQWSDHSACQAMGLMTDMKLVGMEGGSVEVHRAVILPMCPLLTVMEKDVTKENPTVVLEYPMELISAFVNIIYKGSAPTSTVVTILSLLELMASLGLNMPMDRLMIVREAVSEVEIIGYKKRCGLDIIEVNGRQTPASHVNSGRRSFLEIIPSSSGVSSDMGPPTKRRRLNRTAQTPVSTRKLRVKQNRDKDHQHSEEDFNNTGKDGQVEDSQTESSDLVPTVEVKIECGEIAVEEVQPTVSRKRKYNRRRETLEVPAHACEFCDFKCRFLKDIQEHCDLVHSDADFACDKCEFKAKTFAGMTVHNKKRHIGKGDIVCETCGFRAEKKRQMEWHKRNVHAKDIVVDAPEVKADHLKNIGGQTDKDLSNDGVDISGMEAPTFYGTVLSNEEANPKPINQEDTGEGSNKTNDDIDTGDTKDDCVNEDRIIEATEYTNIQDQRKVIVDTETKVGEHLMSDDKEVEIVESDEIPSGTKECGSINVSEEVENVAEESNAIATTDEANDNTSGNSSEVVGFKCSGAGCSRVFRVKFTNPTYVLNRLRAHYAKAHSAGDEAEVLYTTLYKEEVKVPLLEVSNEAEENPLQILKKVKATHKKASSAKKVKNVQVRIKKGTTDGNRN